MSAAVSSETQSGRELERLRSRRETQEIIGVSRATLFRLVQRGDLIATRIGGRTMFHPNDIRALIERGRST